MFYLSLYLASFILLFFFGRLLGKTLSLWVALCSVGAAFGLSGFQLVQVIINTKVYAYKLANWIDIGFLKVSYLFLLDPTSITFSTLISFITFMILCYSYSYMYEDPHIVKFFAYLSLFAFGMTLLVIAGDFLVMFAGWELVGLASYLLINFWDTRTIANASAVKAILFNRIGDVCFLAAISIFYTFYNTLDITAIESTSHLIYTETINIFGFNARTNDLLAILIALAAGAKSAQLFFNNWLPDAMEGPTPVSAVLHSATMVTAGIYLLLRTSSIFLEAPNVSYYLTIVGLLTSVLSSFLGATVIDIKKIIAYSTGSNLGMMFFACGSGFQINALFLLINHAFFKAELFLCAGSVIHATNQQDINKMGALHKVLPVTSITMLIATMSLIGFPFLSGFYSKDFLISALITSFDFSNFMIVAVTFCGVVLSAYYSFRLILKVFYGPSGAPNKTQHIKSHESDFFMLFPIVVLTVPSICFGFLTQDFFFNDYIFFYETMHSSNLPIDIEIINDSTKYIATLSAILGILFSILPNILVNRRFFNFYQKFHLFFDIFENKLFSDMVNNIKLANPFSRILLETIYKIIEKSNETISIIKIEKIMNMLAIFNFAIRLKNGNLIQTLSLLLFTLLFIPISFGLFVDLNSSFVFLAVLPVAPFTINQKHYLIESTELLEKFLTMVPEKQKKYIYSAKLNEITMKIDSLSRIYPTIPAISKSDYLLRRYTLIGQYFIIIQHLLAMNWHIIPYRKIVNYMLNYWAVLDVESNSEANQEYLDVINFHKDKIEALIDLSYYINTLSLNQLQYLYSLSTTELRNHFASKFIYTERLFHLSENT